MAPVDVSWPQVFPDSLNINEVKSAKTHCHLKKNSVMGYNLASRELDCILED